MSLLKVGEKDKIVIFCFLLQYGILTEKMGMLASDAEERKNTRKVKKIENKSDNQVHYCLQYLNYKLYIIYIYIFNILPRMSLQRKSQGDPNE